MQYGDMDDFFKARDHHNNQQKDNIQKGIDSLEIEPFEKALQEGSTKVKNGINYVLRKTPSGKLDWRRSGKATKTTHTMPGVPDAPGFDESKGDVDVTGKSSVIPKSKSVFTNYLKNAEKIEQQQRVVNKYSSGNDYNAGKASDAEDKLQKLVMKESDYLDKFTQKDKDKYEEHFGVPFEE